MKLPRYSSLLALVCVACAPPAPRTNLGRVSPQPSASTEAAAPRGAAIATPPEVVSAAETRRALSELGMRALTAIERDDADGFARVVHPGRGLDVGVCGGVSHRLGARDVSAAFRDAQKRSWDGRSNAGEEPLSMTYGEFFKSLREQAYSRADLVGYNEVVLEDSLCSGPCVAEEIARALPGASFIQYAHGTGTAANPGMWRFVVVAFERDASGWRVIGLLEDTWSP